VHLRLPANFVIFELGCQVNVLEAYAYCVSALIKTKVRSELSGTASVSPSHRLSRILYVGMLTRA
jgi:hypothetical protein